MMIKYHYSMINVIITVLPVNNVWGCNEHSHTLPSVWDVGEISRMTQIQSLRTTLQLLNCFLTSDSDDQIQSFVILACIKNKKDNRLLTSIFNDQWNCRGLGTWGSQFSLTCHTIEKIHQRESGWGGYWCVQHNGISEFSIKWIRKGEGAIAFI